MENPALKVFEKCGGVKNVAEVCERSENRVTRWSYPKERGGTGGLIPAEMQVKLLTASQSRGWDLRPEDFVPSSCLPAATRTGVSDSDEAAA